jgi:hypothetical protein
MTKTMKALARWESRSGKHWVELHHDGVAAIYKADDCGGCIGVKTEAEAVATMQAKVDSGYFLPDSARTPMHRAF